MQHMRHISITIMLAHLANICRIAQAWRHAVGAAALWLAGLDDGHDAPGRYGAAEALLDGRRRLDAAGDDAAACRCFMKYKSIKQPATHAASLPRPRRCHRTHQARPFRRERRHQINAIVQTAKFPSPLAS